MIWAAISIAFFGFLRIGEMTCPGPFSSATHVSQSDVSFHKTNDNATFLNLQNKNFKDRPVSILNHNYKQDHCFAT